jgi:small-conductance mechanosensitive channel
MDAVGSFISQAHSWAASHVLTRSSLLQMLLVLAALLAAVLISRLLILPRLSAKKDLAKPWTDLPLTMVLARVLATPLVALFLVWLAEESTDHFGWPQQWLQHALILLLAWVLTRGAIAIVHSLKKANRALVALITLLIWGVAVFAIAGLLSPVLLLLDDIDINPGGVHLSLLHFIAGALILLVFLGLSRTTSRAFSTWITSKPGVSSSFQALSIKLFQAGFYTLAIVLTLGGLGLDLTNLAWLGGALGLGLGFGLQKVISNLASGFIILADKSIKPGDVIQVGDTYGWVNNLKSRYISVLTRDGIEYLIPNEEMITGKVINWSYSHNLVRVKIPVSVAYGSDLELVMKLLLEAAAASSRVLAVPEPSCRLICFGDSAINFQLRVWINDPQEGVSGVTSEALLEIWKKFQEHDIEIPFPQRVLHCQSLPEIKNGNLDSKPKGK